MKTISSHFVHIVQILNDRQFHDGVSIGHQLGISRTAVWKAIEKLKNYGFKIETKKNKGYRLKEPLILLDKAQIAANIKHKLISFDLFETIDSTNDYLARLITPRNKGIRICLAEYQTQGKGRYQHCWHSPFGQNIYLSLSFSFAKEVNALGGFSLAIGLNVVECLDRICQMPTPGQVKWPNDLFYADKKLGGCLIEVQAEAYGICSVVIGVGINVNMFCAHAQEISQSWTSIYQQTNQYQDRNRLISKLINYLIETIEQFTRHGFQHFESAWQKRDYLKGKMISIKRGHQKLEARAEGINQQGELLIKPKGDCAIITCASGNAQLIKR